jgi:hypothetical protein
MTHHLNNGRCDHCLEIMNLYLNFYRPLRAWFVFFQDQHPEFHISEAGRGKAKQEEDFLERASKAHWLESAHNYNAAMDLFIQVAGRSMYDKEWFNKYLPPALPKTIVWYGRPGCTFREFPHVEFALWRQLRDSGILVPVEPA